MTKFYKNIEDNIWILNMTKNKKQRILDKINFLLKKYKDWLSDDNKNKHDFELMYSLINENSNKDTEFWNMYQKNIEWCTYVIKNLEKRKETITNLLKDRNKELITEINSYLVDKVNENVIRIKNISIICSELEENLDIDKVKYNNMKKSYYKINLEKLNITMNVNILNHSKKIRQYILDEFIKKHWSTQKEVFKFIENNFNYILKKKGLFNYTVPLDYDFSKYTYDIIDIDYDIIK